MAFFNLGKLKLLRNVFHVFDRPELYVCTKESQLCISLLWLRALLRGWSWNFFRIVCCALVEKSGREIEKCENKKSTSDIASIPAFVLPFGWHFSLSVCIVRPCREQKRISARPVNVFYSFFSFFNFSTIIGRFFSVFHLFSVLRLENGNYEEQKRDKFQLYSIHISIAAQSIVDFKMWETWKKSSEKSLFFRS